MRILVTSDSHGDYYTFKKAVLAQPKADAVIFLGDGENDADKIKLDFPDKMVIAVRGNCDFCSSKNGYELITACGKTILATHGHLYNVKFGYEEAYAAAREFGADILLFGHTHKAFSTYKDGLYIMNPGSICTPDPSYGWIDITEKGILTNIVKL